MITKEYFEEIIIEAEASAADHVEILFVSEIKKIERKSLDDNHVVELVSSYMAHSLNEYEMLRNYYKGAYEAYLLFLDMAKREGSKEERIDFISTMLYSMYQDKIFDKKQRLDFLEQMGQLEEIVFETNLLFLKSTAFRKYLKNLKSDKSGLSALEIAYLAYYLIKSNFYPVTGIRKKDWVSEFSKKNGSKNEKNISTSYADIVNAKEERVAVKPEIILKVKNHLQDKYPLALEAIVMAEIDYKKALLRK